MRNLTIKTDEDRHYSHVVKFLETCATSSYEIQKLFDKGIEICILELDNNVVNISTSIYDTYDYIEKQSYDIDRYIAYLFSTDGYEEYLYKDLKNSIKSKNYVEILDAIDYEETNDIEVIQSFKDALADGRFLKEVGLTEFDIEGIDDAYVYLENKLQDLQKNIENN